MLHVALIDNTVCRLDTIHHYLQIWIVWFYVLIYMSHVLFVYLSRHMKLSVLQLIILRSGSNGYSVVNKMIAIKTWVIHFNTQLWLINIIKKTTFSSIAIGLKNFYFSLIHLPSCYQTVCYWTVCYWIVCYRTVQ